VCGKTARTVRREGGRKPIRPPYPYPESMAHCFTKEQTWMYKAARGGILT